VTSRHREVHRLLHEDVAGAATVRHALGRTSMWVTAPLYGRAALTLAEAAARFRPLVIGGDAEMLPTPRFHHLHASSKSRTRSARPAP
jgi:hypothetical protein